MHQKKFIEQRKSERTEVNISVRVSLRSDPRNVFDCQILDISLGGAFIHGTAPVSIGEEVNVEILFGRQEKFSGIATDYEDLLKKLGQHEKPVVSIVRWARGTANSGFGIEFLELTSEQKIFLQKLISHYSSKKK